ncbi:MAG: hypothetical protein QXF15_02510 [Candidatus Aenigmatarchaeota archaeon]
MTQKTTKENEKFEIDKQTKMLLEASGEIEAVVDTLKEFEIDEIDISYIIKVLTTADRKLTAYMKEKGIL